MARIKIDYGIDLGTTNSSICRMEKGEPVVIKTDTLKETLPSCVSVNRRGSLSVGDAAYNTMKSDKRRATKGWHVAATNTYIEFKRTMGTDTQYPCANANRDFTSEELSAEVLKTLRSFVTDEQFRSVVITVPAKFTVGQKTATIEAAKLAGFDRCELLQEPIAASFAYGLTADEKSGIWMVFDFGGGTFDAALLRVEDGIMQVFDTAGDNYLGGKDLDAAIVDKVIVPYLKQHYNIDGILSDKAKNAMLRDAMKTYAEDVKIQLSFKQQDDIISNLGDLGEDEDGEEIELDITVTQQQLFEAIRPIFQKSVDICRSLLEANGLTGADLNKLILVGGPTHSPLIRQMLHEQITPNVDTSIDPMTAVATGAALFASTLDAEVRDEDIEVGTVKLDMGYEATSVETVEWVSVKLDRSGSGSNCPESVLVELERADGAWSSGKVEIDEMGNVIEANLLEGKPNAFTVKVYNRRGDLMPCFPAEITIIQGSKVGAAPLPYNIGIAVWSDRRKRAIFRAATGLEKNKPTPAVGVVNSLSTSRQLRPGIGTDIMTVPIYQCEDQPEQGRTAALYEYVADVVVTGDEVDQLIPENSPVDVTLRVDSSEQMTVEIFFPATDLTVTRPLDTSKKQSVREAEDLINKYISDAQRELDNLSADGVPTASLQRDLNDVITSHQNSQEKKAVLQHLKMVMRSIEDEETRTEWDRLERKLKDLFERLGRAQAELGNPRTEAVLEQYRRQYDQVMRQHDVRTGADLYDQADSLYVQLTLVYQCMALINDCNRRFNQIHWSDSSRARQLINQGLSLMSGTPTTEKLHPIAIAIIDLMPSEEVSGNAGDLLH